MCDSKNINDLQVDFLWPMHCAKGIECVKVFLFLQVCLVEVESFGLVALGDHHVVDDVALLGEGEAARLPGQPGQVRHGGGRVGLGADHWVVGHVVNLCIDILLLIAAPGNIEWSYIVLLRAARLGLV